MNHYCGSRFCNGNLHTLKQSCFLKVHFPFVGDTSCVNNYYVHLETVYHYVLDLGKVQTLDWTGLPEWTTGLAGIFWFLHWLVLFY